MQTITNNFLTLSQPLTLHCSLEMVSANLAKELQNVLPKCNPLHLHIEYHIYGDCVGADGCPPCTSHALIILNGNLGGGSPLASFAVFLAEPSAEKSLKIVNFANNCWR